MPPRSSTRKKSSLATDTDHNSGELVSPAKEIDLIHSTPLEANSCEEVTVAAQTNVVEAHGDYTNTSILDSTPCEKGAIVAQIDGVETLGGNINVPILNNDEDGEEGGDGSSEKDHEKITCIDDEDPEEITNSDENNEDDNENEEYPLMVIDSVISDKKKGKNSEVFVSRLDKRIVEEDLIEVFEKFGEIKSARIVRNITTNKSKGFAFIQYASNEQAESAILASEGGIEVKGNKEVKVSMSNDNNTTLYLGNICRSWTKEQVLETLKSFGIENVEEMRIPGAQKEGRTRGFAFLEFDTHSDATAAFQRLSKPDAIFGRDGSVKVSFSQTSLHPHEEVIPQVKTIYVEGLTDDWTEEKVKELCEQYGKVEEVRLSRTRGKKRKDYGHIDFAARESAIACLEGFKNACNEGVSMVKASFAKPLIKGRPQKQVPHGSLKVEKEREVSTVEEETKREIIDASSNLNGRENFRRRKGKGKMASGEMRVNEVLAEAGGSGKSNGNRTVNKNHLAQASKKSEKAKGKRNNLHMNSLRMSDSKTGHKGKTSEKAQGKNQRNQNTSFGKRKRDTRASKNSNHNADFGTYRGQYATGQAVPVRYDVPLRYEDHSYSTTAGFKRPYADMEPHAGYLEPVTRKQGRLNTGQYEHPVVHYSPHARTIYQPREGHLQTEVGTYHQSRANYQNSPVQVRYVDPPLRTQTQPPAGYYQPTVVGHDLRGFTSERGGRVDLHGIVPSAYREAPSLPPSYPQNYTGRVGYEAGSSGGAYYQSSGVYQPQRGTYR